MSELPPGWEWTTIGEVAHVQLGRQRSPKNHTGPHMRPYLRSANVTWDGIDITDVKEMNFEPCEAATFELQPGDLLLNEASGSPKEVGKPAIWRGEIEGCCFQNTLLRVRPREVSTEYLYWYCRAAALSGRFGEAGRGVNIRHLGKQGLSTFRLALPPLSEQERIVAAIEEHLSRLDAAEAALRSSGSRLSMLWGRLLKSAFQRNGSWKQMALADALSHTIGGVWGAEPQVEEHDVRVLRVTEMGVDGVLDPSTAARRSISAAQLRSRELRIGDLLLEKSGGGPSRPVGRVGRVTSLENRSVCANFMQLLRPDPAIVLSEFLEMALRAFHLAGGTEAMQTATTNIRNLKTKEYLAMPIQLPDLAEQRQVLERLRRERDAISGLQTETEHASRRATALRRAILAAAFSGQLVPQDPADEPASVLLERIRAERAAAAPTKRTRKVKSS